MACIFPPGSLTAIFQWTVAYAVSQGVDRIELGVEEAVVVFVRASLAPQGAQIFTAFM
jgi:hypothetical protein